MVLSDNNSVIIASDIWRLDEDSFLKIFKINGSLDVVWENIIQDNSFQYNPLLITDGNYGACVFWNDGRNDENGIFGKMFDRNGKSSSGDKSGVLISIDESKNNYEKVLSDKNNKNGLNIQEGKLNVPWVTTGADNLYLSTFDLKNINPYKVTPEIINNKIKTGESVSVNYMNDEAVTVFLKESKVYISMNLDAKNTDQGVNDKISLSNFPNPFNPVTKIRYEIPVDFNGLNKVSLRVFDLTGKVVANLVNESQTAGIYETIFNGNNLPSGTYFTKLTIGEYSQVRKIILLK